MVSKQEIKSMVENVLEQMLQNKDIQDIHKDDIYAKSNTTKEKEYSIPHPSSNDFENESVMKSDGVIADISKIDLKKQFLVKHPQNKDGYLKMKEHTPARIGIGRAGTRYRTETMLRFRADHAAAQDSVFSYVNEDFVKSMNMIPVETLCKDKDEFLTRPDLGRRFSKETQEFIKKNFPTPPKVQILVGDGLSSAAIEANVRDIIPAIKQGLQSFGIPCEEKVLFIKHSRVGAMDIISELTGAEVSLILIGERPGLITAKSMSAYIAYKATVGMPEARRTVISNIHDGGTPAVEAGAHIAQIIKTILEKKKSGVDLKL